MKNNALCRPWSTAGAAMIPCRCLTTLLVILLAGITHAATKLVVWGDNNYGQADLPSDLDNVIACVI